MERLENISAPTPVPVEISSDQSLKDELTGKAIELQAMKVQSFFGLEQPTQAESKSMSEIIRILDGQNKEVADLLWEIKNLESRIGTPPLGMSRLQHVYNFLAINSQIKKLEKERDAFL
jgi:hypothetical protein